MNRPITNAAPGPTDDPTDLQSRITSLVADPNFEQIRSKLTKFNFFEAIRAQRQEVRHSAFLAFLLDPRKNHGLGDAFLKRFLKRSLKAEASFSYPGPNDFQVERENMHVDIFLHDEKHSLAVIIENKIDSGEHGNQLENYWNETRGRYQELFGIYLTPAGEKPEGSDHYVPFSYADVADLIDEILASEKATCAPAVKMVCQHYVEMLRRDILPNSELRQLCEAVYFKHRDVLDKIFEFKPDLQAVIREYVKSLVVSEPEKFADPENENNHVRFAVKEWEAIEKLRKADGWKRILYFQFYNMPDSLKLRLVIGPGDDVIRQKLLDVALENNDILRAEGRLLKKYWHIIYSRPVLSKAFLVDPRMSDVEETVKKEWKIFVDDDLPKILELIRSIKWDGVAQSGRTPA